MDPLELLASLEGLREKIPAFLRQDFEDLIAGIRNTYEMSVKYVTPPEPVHDGRRNLAAHHTTLDGLCTQLESSLEAFQLVYVGQASDAYHTRAAASLQDLQVIREHLAQAAVLHNTMATNFDTATEAKLALVALLVTLGITLGVLIASAGTTAPVTVPAAAVEVAGGAVSIGLMTEAEAAAVAAIMGLIWSALPDALLAGLAGFAATEVLGHITLHPPITTQTLQAKKAQPLAGPTTPESLPPEVRKQLDDAGLTASQKAVAAMLYGKGMIDVAELISIVQAMNENQLTFAQKLGENANLTASDIINLVMHRLTYRYNSKHKDIQVGNIGAKPIDGQRALDNSVEIKSTTTRRVGVDPVTGEIVIFDNTNDGTIHGHVRTWDQLRPEQQNALKNKGIIDSKGNIIIRDSQGNIIKTGINVIKGKGK